MVKIKPAGSQKTKQFYENIGWQEQNGQTVDNQLFGAREDGPIRQTLCQVHDQRIRAALAQAGDSINLLECGCGGNPATELLDLCSAYSGVDFSSAGLEVAKKKLETLDIPVDIRQADVCDLPFADGQFDAVFSTQMIYHIPDPNAQRLALQEMLRVIKPHGVLVLISANPRPLLFPLRLVKRIIADTPGISAIANAIRPAPLLPYQPMTLGWLRRQVRPYGDTTFVAQDVPSTAFYQGVTEHTGLGKQLWKGIQWLDINYPKVSAYLGNYVQMTVFKSKNL